MTQLSHFKEIAASNGLLSVSCSYLAECGKFSVGVQWNQKGIRECSSVIDADPAVALTEALAGKAQIENRSAEEKAERAERLRAELALLEADAA